jgi:hypothetical protein
MKMAEIWTPDNNIECTDGIVVPDVSLITTTVGKNGLVQPDPAPVPREFAMFENIPIIGDQG